MEQQIQSGHISFPFHCYDSQVHRNRTIEKSDTPTGKKRKYLEGYSSGIAKDAHEERMTEKCIKSFMDQANSGDILLFPDIHGIKESEDIGIMTKAQIDADNNWWTEYRLYDENDGIGQFKLEKCNDIWKQINGLLPYQKPRQKGFSIEGNIPEGGLAYAEKDELGNPKRRVIDNVVLDGVVLVPRPAYKMGIANAVYKFLGELPPWKAEFIKSDISNEFEKMLKDEEISNIYFRKRWDIMDALDKSIERVMSDQYKSVDKSRQLDILFDQYKQVMKTLIISSESMFRAEQETGDIINSPYGQIGEVSKADIFKFILSELEKLNRTKFGGKK